MWNFFYRPDGKERPLAIVATIIAFFSVWVGIVYLFS
jgi:hypothetical protein